MGDGIRPELSAFVSMMESRLRENSGRGDWRTFNFYYLIACLVSNVGQLVRTFQVDKPDIVLRSAADVANYAMMIADLYGGMSARKR